ncbi:MAG: 3-deoxy-D-manno-octulosonic acid transferase [Rhodocyclaceae bacterium]|nr:3-deoxy-D-manno-octulosonic acid transferase [Rhodocyclaceae bacterium]
MLHLLWRARRQPEYLQHWGERFGFYGAIPADAVPHAGHFIPATGHSVPPAPTFQTFWIHAVSVGETRAAQPLIAALREQFPACRILLTHMTPTGRAASEGLFGDSVERVYLPYDTPWAVRRFLRHFRPTLGLIMETELWPNLIAACHEQGLPLLLVNARLSEKSARRYARFPRLARQALEQLTAISAIGNDDAERLRALGAPTVTVTGNMKFDMTPPAEQVEVGEVLRARLGTRPVFLCASTREGEEALILDAWSKVGAGPSQADAHPVTASGDFMGGSEPGLRARGANKVGAGGTATLLVIVPRHPQRFAAVAQLVTQRGLKMQRRSDDAPVAVDTQVWLGDSMGELFAYYAAADVAFVGGSLLDFGCQNLIEPCAVGVPVLIGPSTFNFAEAARAALATGAARQIGNAAGLVEQALTILTDEACKQAMGEAGRAFAARHRGATRRTMALILALTRETTAPA